MAMVGMSVARRLWRKRYMTQKTRPMAMKSVFTTSSIEIFTKGVVSYG